MNTKRTRPSDQAKKKTMSIELSLANERRASRAAAQRVTQARRALAVLESNLESPHNTWLWIEVLQLRVNRDTASLTDLAAAMSPPMTKDRYAALLRRACQFAESYQSFSKSPAEADTAEPATETVTATRQLTDDQMEILQKFGNETRWLRPLDLGGNSRSNHSEVLAQLTARGLVEAKVRRTGARNKLYRITPAGAESRHVPRTFKRGPLAAVIESASLKHGGASDRRLAEIARQAGHEISHHVLSRLHRGSGLTNPHAPTAAVVRAIAFLSQMPETDVLASYTQATAQPRHEPRETP